MDFYKLRNFLISDGKSGYIKIATITIYKHNADSPILFDISRRGSIFSTLNIRFRNCAHTNPPVDLFTTTSYPNDFYLHHRISDKGVWDLFVLKSESWDRVCVMRYLYNSYTMGNCVEFSNPYYVSDTELPTGGINPQIINS